MSSFSARLCPSSLPSSWSPANPRTDVALGGFQRRTTQDGTQQAVHVSGRGTLYLATARQQQAAAECCAGQQSTCENGAASATRCAGCGVAGSRGACMHRIVSHSQMPEPCSKGGTPESWRSSLAARRAGSRGGGRYPPPLGGFAPEAGAGCWGAPSTAGAMGLVSDCGDRVPPLGALLAAAARTLASLACLFGRSHSTPKVSWKLNTDQGLS